MKKCIYLIFIFFLLGCQKEKNLNDYNRNDFVEIQGIVLESEEENSLLSKSTWNIKYFFKTDKITYNGKQSGFNMPMATGQAIIVLVNKKNPHINFFKEIGVLVE